MKKMYKVKCFPLYVLIHNCQNSEAIKMFFGRCMNKLKNKVHPDNGMLVSTKKK